MKTRLSKWGTLNWRDGLRGLVVAVISSVLTALLQTVEAGDLTIDWTSMYRVAILAGGGYILKNWLFEPAKVITTTTNSEAIATKAVVKEAVKSE